MYNPSLTFTAAQAAQNLIHEAERRSRRNSYYQQTSARNNVNATSQQVNAPSQNHNEHIMLPNSAALTRWKNPYRELPKQGQLCVLALQKLYEQNIFFVCAMTEETQEGINWNIEGMDIEEYSNYRLLAWLPIPPLPPEVTE